MRVGIGALSENQPGLLRGSSQIADFLRAKGHVLLLLSSNCSPLILIMIVSLTPNHSPWPIGLQGVSLMSRRARDEIPVYVVYVKEYILTTIRGDCQHQH